MSTTTQARRTLSVTTPLGEDALLLQGFSGAESISRLFRYELELASTDEAIPAKAIVGKPVGWSVNEIDKAPRFFHGRVSRFVAGPLDRRKFRVYRAEVVPWLWFLGRTSDCRIFQGQSTPDIVKQVFDDLGFSDYELNLKGSYDPRDYCVQYRETALNFVSRLLEWEGIFYYFRHEEGKHVLVLGDAPGAYAKSAEATVSYSSGSLAPNHVSDWEHHFEFRTGKWAHTDYNFETPSTSLLTDVPSTLPLDDAPKFEFFDFPGEYAAKGAGEGVVRVRMEEEEAGHDVATGSSRCCSFSPGAKFTLEEHDVDAENGEYVVTTIHHSAVEASYGNQEAGTEYHNRFSCVPAKVPFRPARSTPRPMVQGVQTAVVTGPAGEEIYVDKYGRVKVQFFWDRRGQRDEKSSCWVRVSQEVAGKGFGAMVIPRMGQEVIIEFLEGDPDRPVITGRLYNAEQMPPYGLPAEKVVSGTKSKTYKGTGYNEMIFNDTPGNELIRVHGQYDMDSTIENDLREHVLNNRSRDVAVDETISIGSNQKYDIGANQTGTVGADKSLTIGANHTENIGSNMSIGIGGNLTETVGINYAETVGAAMELTVGAFMALSVGAVMTHSVGASYSLSVGSSYSQGIGSNLKQSVGAKKGVQVGSNLTEKVGGKQTTQIGGDLLEKVGGKYSETVSGDYKLKAANITLDAKSSITLKTGAASITMKSGGAIEIKGTNIKVVGSAKIEEKAPQINSEASAKNTVKGAMVNVEASAINTIKGSLVKIN